MFGCWMLVHVHAFHEVRPGGWRDVDLEKETGRIEEPAREIVR